VDAAGRVAAILKDLGVEAAVIGAMALACHKYVRQTHDLVLPFRDSWHDCAPNEDQFNGADRRQLVQQSRLTRPSERSRPAARRASESILRSRSSSERNKAAGRLSPLGHAKDL
jgi:hypothetical protein